MAAAPKNAVRQQQSAKPKEPLASPRGETKRSRQRPAREALATTSRGAVPGGELARARAQLAEVKRDPAKRRYRDRWERAIAALEKAAHGRDRGPALLEAARARYALYRFSQVESDRTAALALARRAETAGAREASLLRIAIRKEMGEPATPRPAPTGARVVRGAPPPPRSGSVASSATVPRTSTGPRPTPPPAAARRAEGAKPVPEAGPAPRFGGLAAPDEEPPVDAILEQALASDDPGAATSADAAAEAQVSELKTWSNHDYTRIAVYLSRPVAYQRIDLPADAEHPRRVALDLRPAHLARALAEEVGDALVRRVRAAQLDAATVRVVVDLAGDEDLTAFPLDEPARLIVDVGRGAAGTNPVATAPARAAAPEARAPQAPPSAAPPPDPSSGEELAASRPIRRIIVDAGHGGHDTGAIGPTGVREKDVTLAMAKRVAKRLRDRGYEVVLTRDDDRYVPLEERTAIANARHGDLFLSLHANAHPRRDRNGVETYILNVTSDRYAARLAARENGALGDTSANIPVLRRILSDLEAKMSVEASRRVAIAVQRELCAAIRARVGDVRDLGVKSALFHVLLGARMPAVLVETAFISNRVEERRLARSAFQEEVAAAVVRAVDRVAADGARIASAR